MKRIIILVSVISTILFVQCKENKINTNNDIGNSDYLNLMRNFDVFINLEDIRLKDVFIFKSNADSQLLSKLVSKEQLVVVYFSVNTCMTCLTDLFNFLKKEPGASFLCKMVILACSPDYRIAYSFMRKYNIMVPIYQIQINSQPFYENIDGPLLFILNPSLRISRVLETAQQPESVLIKYFKSLTIGYKKVDD